MNKLDTYLSLCSEYYDLDKPQASNELLAFYREYLKQSKGPVLEPMCGTGNFLLPFTKEGFDIEGYDASDAMLSILKRKAKEESLRPRFWKQMADKATKENHYNLVFIPLGSFGLLIKDEDLSKGLKSIFNTLAPGGKLVFDGETVDAFSKGTNTWQGYIREKDDGSYLMLNTLSLPIQNHIGTIICRYESICEGQIVKTEVEKFKLRFHQPETLVKKLKDAGFSDIKLTKAYKHGAKADSKDQTIIYECTKL